MSLFPQRWAGKTVVIAASGHSMLEQAKEIIELRKQRDFVILAVNRTFRLFPRADAMYAGDFLFWKNHIEEVRRNFRGECWTCDHSTAERWKIQRIKGVNKRGLGTQYLCLNGNSAFQALNLAFLFGARHILLTGFDMKLGPNGEKHWHADYPSPMVQGQQFNQWIDNSVMLAADLERYGARVINCTPGSALKVWPVGDLKTELGVLEGT